MEFKNKFPIDPKKLSLKQTGHYLECMFKIKAEDAFLAKMHQYNYELAGACTLYVNLCHRIKLGTITECNLGDIYTLMKDYQEEIFEHVRNYLVDNPTLYGYYQNEVDEVRTDEENLLDERIDHHKKEKERYDAIPLGEKNESK